MRVGYCVLRTTVVERDTACGQPKEFAAA